MLDTILNLAIKYRESIVTPGDRAYGGCYTASWNLKEILEKYKIKSRVIEGSFKNRVIEEGFKNTIISFHHFWLEITINDEIYILDVTADQFTDISEPVVFDLKSNRLQWRTDEIITYTPSVH